TPNLHSTQYLLSSPRSTGNSKKICSCQDRQRLFYLGRPLFRARPLRKYTNTIRAKSGSPRKAETCPAITKTSDGPDAEPHRVVFFIAIERNLNWFWSFALSLHIAPVV